MSKAKCYPSFLIVLFLFGACSSKEASSEGSDVLYLPSPAGTQASLPYLISGEDNALYMSWVEEQDSGWAELKYARLTGESWTEPELIARGNDWFVNWADYPMIAVDKDGNMLAHILVKSAAATYAYDIQVRYKPANGQWSEPIVPHQDGTQTEHGFVTMLPKNDGTFQLAWLDGRNMAKEGSGGHENHDSGGAMTLRSAVIGPDGDISNPKELDARVCDCCQTGGTTTENGALIVYRDRSESEIRDISFVHLQDSMWSTPARVHADDWEIMGCPVNGPRVSSSGGVNAVAWFTNAKSRAVVKMAFGSGDTFDDPIFVDDTMPMGRVDIVQLDAETALVSWLDLSENAAIMVREVRRDGSLSVPKVVSQTSEERGSGFPQMAVANGEVYLAWTDLEASGETTVQVAKIAP